MSTGVAPQLLETVVPLRELDDDGLQTLAAEAELVDVGGRSVIFRAGQEEDWLYYVLSGEVILVDADGGQRSVVGMGDVAVAEEPLGFEAPYAVNALARTEVRLIRLARSRVLEQLESQRLPDYEVGAVGGDSAGADGLFAGLVQDLMEDRLELPSMPDIAVRVRQAVSDEKSNAATVTKIIQADPVVAARVLQAANSALYGGQRSVDSLNQAVVRLGLRNVRELVMAVTMREVFKTRHPLLNRRMVELWMHSTLVASVAAVLARRLGSGFDPDRALLAGLVHDIGVVPMIGHAGDYPELAEDPTRLEEAIGRYRGDVGSMILRRWNFPDDMIAVVLDAEDWTRAGEGKADYADLVIAAQLQTYAGTPDAGRYPDLDGLPVAARLGLAAAGVTQQEPILEEAREEIAEVQKLLIGG
ncbi:HDOD domain-containing protein [Spiribacter halobius]|uniref:Signal transduction protein n=1 Tax=Sediminicurvatus halobius TaxID=2182432 RepID=A0A2U2MWB2_9GAMM|nr:HDOD domain-containing protein [Spiribacter halobius]PWG61143.1 signal transduction protein [Spiribacter halobius]UEX78648.1 HDOD domain-containing protein [Spiribacter halobius]